jgi:peptidoglycan/LPS O-acetylase OafA/YrhL
MQSPHPKYRADIDGLRAVAVLAVVGFHAFPIWFKGGFVGVDVFFVISGFLISTILMGSLEAGKFRLADFYVRRIRRIFPALFLTLLSCYLFGWWALTAEEFKQLGKHLAGGAGFVANIVLWQESGYFDTITDTKPFLHLWSLGIEEQFYIIWPILLWLAWKRKFGLGLVTVGITILSFALNIYTVQTDLTGAFYSPQTRFWELMFGAGFAWINLRGAASSGIKNRFFQNVLSVGGMVFILLAIWLTDREKSFPGWWALLPTIGALGIVAAGPEAWLNRKVISNRIFVWFGLISFPLYLWHWPLLSFGRILSGTVPSRSFRVVAVLISIALAWLTYRFVENPIRSRPSHKGQIFFLTALMAVLCGAGLHVYFHDGYPARSANQLGQNSEQIVWSSDKNSACTDILGYKHEQLFCLLLGNPNNIEMAVLGDSTANALAPGLAGQMDLDNQGLINLGQGTCPPVRHLFATAKWGGASSHYAPGCPELMTQIYDYILKSNSIKTVILSFYSMDILNWGLPESKAAESLEERFSIFRQKLDDDMAELKASGKKVILIFDTPHLPVEGLACVERKFGMRSGQECSVSVTEVDRKNPAIPLFRDAYMASEIACIFSVADKIAKDGIIHMQDSAGILMFRDDHHLSYHGSDLIAKRIFNSDCLKP